MMTETVVAVELSQNPDDEAAAQDSSLSQLVEKWIREREINNEFQNKCGGEV